MRYRLYFFVPYNISDIQKGIQAGHAALEYAREFGHTQEYVQFIENDKTWVILNGGTTRRMFNNDGDINNIETYLISAQIPLASFSEPDLNNALSAICFLADERVWDKELYPDYKDPETLPEGCSYVFPPQSFEDWKKSIGGNKNVFLRELLKDKHLA